MKKVIAIMLVLAVAITVHTYAQISISVQIGSGGCSSSSYYYVQSVAHYHRYPVYGQAVLVWTGRCYVWERPFLWYEDRICYNPQCLR